MGVSGVGSGGVEQGQLFEQDHRERERTIDTMVDAVKSRFGDAALRRGGGARRRRDGRLD